MQARPRKKSSDSMVLLLWSFFVPAERLCARCRRESETADSQRKGIFMDYKKLAYDLIPLVGGVQNISKLTHCGTRLRFEFHDRSKVDAAAIEKTAGVISVVERADSSRSLSATTYR